MCSNQSNSTRMAKAKVFISGMDALGVEIAKNVALAGVKKLTVHDTKAATLLDLTNYYLTEANVTNSDNRAVASATKLHELNRLVVGLLVFMVLDTHL